MTHKLFTGVCKGCGSIIAAMVDDEKTTGTEIYEFIGDILKRGRELVRCDGPVQLQHCKCKSQGKKEEAK